MNKWAMAGGAVLALGMTSPAAFAVEDRFDYFELQGTGTGDLNDDVDIEEGISLEAAKSANDVVFVRGTVDTYNFDTALPGQDDGAGTETGLDFMSVGPGVGVPLGMFYLWGQVSYERLNYGGEVGNGPGAEVGATIGPTDGMQLGVTARRGEPNFSGSDDIEYDLYGVDGRLPVGEATHLVVSYQEGTLETPDEDVDLNEVVSLGLRLGF
ncbi:MAG: hypothetical protein WEC99_07985 [Halofilum sp. (in: g-proteobacteria)]